MKPLTKILLIIFLNIILCQLAFIYLNKGLVKYNNHSTIRLNEIFNSNTNYDILFIGSSRTHTGINPRIIDSICNASSYNAGVEGGNLLEFKMTYEAYLQNHPAPKVLVLSIDFSSFNLKRKFFNYTQYFPYLKNRVIDSTLNHNGYNTTLQKFIPFISITDFDDYSKGNAVKGLTGKGGKQIPDGEFQYKGYLSNSNKIITAEDTGKMIHTIDFNKEAIQYLNDIIYLCNKNKTKPVFTYAPEYNFGIRKQFINCPEFFSLVEKTAQNNAIPFLRHDSLSICKNPKMFANTMHLNTLGAEEYSGILADQLNKLYFKKK